MIVSKKDKWGGRGRVVLACFLCCVTMYLVILLFYGILFMGSGGTIQITESAFWYYSGIIALMGTTIGGLFVAGLRAWDIQGLVYRIENKWTANMIKTGVEELMKERGWD